MRFFLELAYKGTNFVGYQSQPNGISVQSKLETALSTLFKTPVEIVGCGRTDAGVHASQYFAHFDAPYPPAHNLTHSLNALVGNEIAVYGLHEVADDAHARFDAIERAYEYHIFTRPNPFQTENAYIYNRASNLDWEKIEQACALLATYKEFAPFCKTNTDTKTRFCRIDHADWEHRPENHQLIFHIQADRFLRGMVRLIVGMCLNVGAGKLSIAALRACMDAQSILPFAYSVPPQGLFLSKVKYAYL